MSETFPSVRGDAFDAEALYNLHAASEASYIGGWLPTISTTANPLTPEEIQDNRDFNRALAEILFAADANGDGIGSNVPNAAQKFSGRYDVLEYKDLQNPDGSDSGASVLTLQDRVTGKVYVFVDGTELNVNKASSISETLNDVLADIHIAVGGRDRPLEDEPGPIRPAQDAVRFAIKTLELFSEQYPPADGGLSAFDVFQEKYRTRVFEPITQTEEWGDWDYERIQVDAELAYNGQLDALSLYKEALKIQLSSDLGIAPEDITLVGDSLGGSLAIWSETGSDKDGFRIIALNTPGVGRNGPGGIAYEGLGPTALTQRTEELLKLAGRDLPGHAIYFSRRGDVIGGGGLYLAPRIVTLGPVPRFGVVRDSFDDLNILTDFDDALVDQIIAQHDKAQQLRDLNVAIDQANLLRQSLGIDDGEARDEGGRAVKSVSGFVFLNLTLFGLFLFIAILSTASAQPSGSDSYILNFDLIRDGCVSDTDCDVSDCVDRKSEAKNSSDSDAKFTSDANHPLCKVRREVAKYKEAGKFNPLEDKQFNEKISKIMARADDQEKKQIETYLLIVIAKYYYETGEYKFAQHIVTAYSQKYCSGEESMRAFLDFAYLESKRGNIREELRLLFQAARVAEKAGRETEVQQIIDRLYARTLSVKEQRNIDLCETFIVARPKLGPGSQNKYLETDAPNHPLYVFVKECN